MIKYRVMRIETYIGNIREESPSFPTALPSPCTLFPT